jgi:hypothetical protein
MRVGTDGHATIGLAGREAVTFLKKSNQKTFAPAGVARLLPQPAGPKVFCFPGRGAFFSKKKRLS